MSDAQDLEVLLRSSEARAQAILKASIDAVVIMDHHGRFLDYNPAAEAMFGYPRATVMGLPIADFIIPPSLRASHHDGMVHYLSTGQGPVINQRIEVPAQRANGEEFPVELTIVPIEGESNPVFVGFIRDISVRKQEETRRAMLLDEIAHRGKNLLAVVQSIVYRTLKDHPRAEARQILDRRLSALARSHASLVANPSGAPLSLIVASECEGFSNRMHFEGPELHLKATAAQTMALIVHELATNATKYGSLSLEAGHVEIRWSVSATLPSHFAFEWSESGGPSVVAPTRSGFGRTVLEQIAASEFHVAPTIGFDPSGLTYRFTAPLDLMVEPEA